MELAALLQQCPIIAILRGIRPAEAAAVCAVLEDAGIRIVEVPLNSPEPFKSISILSEKFGSRLLIGAGTVTCAEEVIQVGSAGGRLIVMPHADTQIVRFAKAAGMITIPGAFSPTDALAVLKAGADAVKLFPAEVLGPAMLRALRVVLPPGVLLIPVGGIEADNVGNWIAAGAHGLGVGSGIYKPGDSPSAVAEKARALVSAASQLA